MHLKIREFTLQSGRFDYDPPIFEMTIGLSQYTGKSVTVLGGNGSGKTSLANALAGMYPRVIPVRAKVRFSVSLNGNTISYPETHKLCRIVAQRWQHNFLGYPVKDEVALAISSSDQWRMRVLDALDIKRFYSRSIYTLSDGEKQRVAAAVALTELPALLVTDEWLTHLDMKWKTILVEIQQEYVNERGGCHIALVSSIRDHFASTLVKSNTVVNSGERQSNLERFSRQVSGEIVLDSLTQLDQVTGQPSTHLPDSPIRYNHSHKRTILLHSHPGDITEIIGGNGTGKTTLLYNLWKHSNSYIRRVVRKVAGNTYPQVHVILDDSVYQVVGPTVHDELTRVFHGAHPEIITGIEEALIIFLKTSSQTDVLSLSHGQRKLLALLSIVGSPAPVIAIDEPFAALDEENCLWVSRLIQIAAAKGKMIFVTGTDHHDIPRITNTAVLV